MPSTNQSLLGITKLMPCKQINVDGPYLQRYMMGQSECRQWDYWLHRYIRPDPDKHHHNHQWLARSIVLNGGVTEDTPQGTLTRCAVAEPLQAAHDMMHGIIHPSAHTIHPDTWHRIASVEPDTWTMLAVNSARTGGWQFMEPDGTVVEMEGSPREWWRGYGPRGTNPGDAP